MKTLVVKQYKTVSILTMFAFLVLATVPALANEFEVGTQFGISHLIEGDDLTTSFTSIKLPANAFLDIGSSPTSLYATWFPSKQFAIGSEFSFGSVSISAEYQGESETESLTALHLGSRAAFFPLSHLRSSPYVLGRVSRTIFSGSGDDDFFSDEETLTSFGGGLGYQWRIGAAFVFRAEGQYQRLLLSNVDDGANEFSLIFGLGTRFGNGKSQHP